MSTFLGLVLAYMAVRMLFPRFDNDRSCESDAPMTAAEIAAFYHARARKEVECSNSKGHCQFLMSRNPDESITIHMSFVEQEFWEGCTGDGYGSVDFLYDREGRFLRAPEMPYG